MMKRYKPIYHQSTLDIFKVSRKYFITFTLIKWAKVISIVPLPTNNSQFWMCQSKRISGLSLPYFDIASLKLSFGKGICGWRSIWIFSPNSIFFFKFSYQLFRPTVVDKFLDQSHYSFLGGEREFEIDLDEHYIRYWIILCLKWMLFYTYLRTFLSFIKSLKFWRV